MFYVEDIRPMAWNDRAFDHLVYDEQQKDLVLSFVENHSHAKPIMGDVIMGKGRLEVHTMFWLLSLTGLLAGEGLIVLLSGPPGTGKTLTAEAGQSRPPYIGIGISRICPWLPVSGGPSRGACSDHVLTLSQLPIERTALYSTSKQKILA
jgi:hypothetical protein